MTCDWGDCDAAMVAYRWDPALGQWLPACDTHAVLHYWKDGHCPRCHRNWSFDDTGCGCGCHYTVQDILDLQSLEA